MEKLIVGLGNPGLRYRNTKHNAGFWVVDALAKRESITLRRRMFNAQWGRGRIDRTPVVLCKPLTFMNLSGTAVRRCSAYFDIPPAQMLVVVDDADLPLGTLRLRPDGTAGGHNGLRSIAEHVGTERIARLRVGIGTAERDRDLAAYVLRPFSSLQQKQVAQRAVETAVAAVICWVCRGMAAAMNQFNRTDEHDG